MIIQIGSYGAENNYLQELQFNNIHKLKSIYIVFTFTTIYFSVFTTFAHANHLVLMTSLTLTHHMHITQTSKFKPNKYIYVKL